MTDVASETALVPFTGELVPLAEPLAVAKALEDLREYQRGLSSLRAVLEEALVAESRRRGTKTLHLGQTTAVITGGRGIEWDMEELAKLRDAGLPEERFSELVKTEISYKVDARVANQLSSANEEYAAIIGRARAEVEKPWRVRIDR